MIIIVGRLEAGAGAAAAECPHPDVSTPARRWRENETGPSVGFRDLKVHLQ